MSRRRIRLLPVAAAIFMLAGFGLMIAALRIDTQSVQSNPTTLAAGAVVPTVATAAVAAGTPAASDPLAKQIFARAQAANRELDYAGVKVLSRWDRGQMTNVVVSVRHVAGRGTAVSLGDVGVADASKVSAAHIVESGTDDESAMLGVLVRNYRLVSVGSTTILGRSVAVVEADRADGTVAARFWVDDKSGLVLRRALVDTVGRTVETSSYLRVEFDPKVAPAANLPAPTRAWSQVDEAGVAVLRAQGWPVVAALTGGMNLYQVRQQQAADGTVVQLSYTDGLVAMSVFLQRGALDRASLDGYVPTQVAGGEVWGRPGSLFFVWQSQGGATAPSTAPVAGSSSRDIVVSATTDSPLAPIGSVLEALPAQAPDTDGVGDRVTRGVQRVTSWFRPAGVSVRTSRPYDGKRTIWWTTNRGEE